MTKDGKPVGVLGVMNGNPALSLMDINGDDRLFLIANKDYGIVKLTGGKSGPTYLANGLISIGSEKTGGVSIAGSGAGGPMVKVYDSSGYSASLGRAVLTDGNDGTITVSSAATLTGVGNGHAYAWSLLSQPQLARSKMHGSGESPGKHPSLHLPSHK
jgi:hypothetical protein